MAATQFLRPFVLAAVALVAWSLNPSPALMPPVFPMGDQLTYAPVDDPAVTLLEPVLHAPWLGTSPLPVRSIVATLVVLGASAVALLAGASLLATLFMALALVLDVSFGAAVSHVGGLAVAVGLIWLAATATFASEQPSWRGRRWFNPAVAIILWSLAIWWDWIAILTWPVVAAALQRAPQRALRAGWTVISLVAGAAGFLAHFAWMASEARDLSFAPGLSLTWQDAFRVAFEARAAMPLGSFVSPDLTTRLAYLAMALALVGLLFGGLAHWWRRAVALSGMLMLAAALAWSEWRAEVLRFGIWTLMPLAAVGLTWVSRQTRRIGWAPAITCVLGAVLIAETVVMGARPLGGQDARVFRDALETALESRIDSGALVVVAEDTRIDSAVASWASARRSVLRAPQDSGVVGTAVAAGRTVLAGPVARRHLELGGVVFGDAFAIGDPAPFRMSAAVAALTCATVRADRWSHLPGVEYTGRLGLQVPHALTGELQLIVGDQLPLHLRAETPDGRGMPVVVDGLLTGPGSDAPPADYWLDGGLPEDGPRLIKRVHVPAQAARATLMSLWLGRRAPRVLARLIGFDDTARGRVCAAISDGPALFEEDLREIRVPLEDDAVFGTGWYGVEGPRGESFRWADRDAVVLLRSLVRTSVDVTIEAEAAHQGERAFASGPAIVTLRVNGIDITSQRLRGGMQRYEWRVPAGVWLAGTNELWWHTTHAVRPADTGGTDTRTLALRVAAITVHR